MRREGDGDEKYVNNVSAGRMPAFDPNLHPESLPSALRLTCSISPRRSPPALLARRGGGNSERILGMFKLLKKNLLAVGALGLGVTGVASAQTQSQFVPVPQQNTHFESQLCAAPKADCGLRFGIFGEFLYLTPRNSEVAFAQPVDGLGLLGAPTGRVAQVEPDYQTAWRFGASVQLSSGFSLQI